MKELKMEKLFPALLIFNNGAHYTCSHLQSAFVFKESFNDDKTLNENPF